MPSDLSVSIVQRWGSAGSGAHPHLLMGALCADAVLFQVFLIALLLLLQVDDGGCRTSQDFVCQWPPRQAVARNTGETHSASTQQVWAAALTFVVLSAEVEDSLQPLPLLWKSTKCIECSAFIQSN